MVRIHNTNTGKIIVSRFNTQNGEAAVAGEEVLAGVSGSGAPIRLEFNDPGGAKTGKLLPTGHAKDALKVAGLGRVEASLIDAANPCVFVSAAALACTGAELPVEIERNVGLMDRLEAIRRSASVAMGIAPTEDAAADIPSVPKVAMVSPPAAVPTLSGSQLAPDEMDIGVRMISVGQPHRAVPLTGALCLAVATRLVGSLPHEMAGLSSASAPSIRIAQASGVTVVDAKFADPSANRGEPRVEYAAVYRTARRLFEGYVRCPI